MTELSLDECIEIVIRALTDEGPVFDASLFETANVGPYEGANVAPEDSIQIDRAKAFAMWADGLPIYYLHHKLSAVVFKPCPVHCVLLQSGLPSGRLAIVGANITSSVRAVRDDEGEVVAYTADDSVSISRALLILPPDDRFSAVLVQPEGIERPAAEPAPAELSSVPARKRVRRPRLKNRILRLLNEQGPEHCSETPLKVLWGELREALSAKSEEPTTVFKQTLAEYLGRDPAP
jgi:hypothetical protein